MCARRWWERVGPWRGFWPDEQNGAAGVVDDEARGRREAGRSEPVAVAVAGADQQVGADGCLQDLVFHAAVAVQACSGAAEPVGGDIEKLGSSGRGEGSQVTAGVVSGGTPTAEQPEERAMSDVSSLVVGDVEQDDPRLIREPGASGVDAGGPRSLGDPDDCGCGHDGQPPDTATHPERHAGNGHRNLTAVQRRGVSPGTAPPMLAGRTPRPALAQC